MKCIPLCLLALGCSASAPPVGTPPTDLDDSCLYLCSGVQSVPPCAAEHAAGALPASEVAAAEGKSIGERVRVSGRLQRREGSWTQIDCPRNTCCAEQLDPTLAVGELALSGSYQLADGRAGNLQCVSRAGMMVQSPAASPDAPFALQPWERKVRGEPAREQLQRAYCCSLDARGQEVIVEGTLAASERAFAPTRLLDPFICAVGGPDRR
jgi:hypothetical protein